MKKASRAHLTIAHQQEIVETLMDRLDGMPVQAAIDVLELVKKQVLYLSTISKPEDDLRRRQIAFESIPHSSSPTAHLANEVSEAA